MLGALDELGDEFELLGAQRRACGMLGAQFQAAGTLRWIVLDEVVDLLGGEQLAFVPLVTELTAALASLVALLLFASLGASLWIVCGGRLRGVRRVQTQVTLELVDELFEFEDPRLKLGIASLKLGIASLELGDACVSWVDVGRRVHVRILSRQARSGNLDLAHSSVRPLNAYTQVGLCPRQIRN